MRRSSRKSKDNNFCYVRGQYWNVTNINGIATATTVVVITGAKGFAQIKKKDVGGAQRNVNLKQTQGMKE